MIHIVFYHRGVKIKMKTVHVFDIADYHHALSPSSMHDGIFYRQKGGGVGGAFGVMKRYSIPIVKKYVIPHFREAVLNTVKDVALHGSTVGGAIKNNTKKFFGGIGNDIYSNIVQSGKGISRKRISKTSKRSTKIAKSASKKKVTPKKITTKRKVNPRKSITKKPTKTNIKKKTIKPKSKLDILS